MKDLKLFFWKDENYKTTIKVPPNSINIPPPDSMVMLDPDGTVKVMSFGIVNTTPFGTITFPSAVASPVIVQVELTVQSSETGGEQGGVHPY